MKIRTVFMLLALGFICPGLEALEIVYKTVESVGEGKTESEAIRWAQINAVQEVTGSTNAVSEWASEGYEKTSSRTSVKSNYEIKISKEAAGLIRSYEVVDTSYVKGKEVWLARLSVSVLDVDKSAGRKSTFVPAILTKNTTQQAFADQVTRSIKSNLVSSRKFSVFERQLDPAIKAEIDSIIENPMLPLSDKIIAKNTFPVELILAVKIEGITLKIREWTLSPNLLPVRAPESSISISYQVIDVVTSKIEFQDVATFEFGQQEFNEYQVRVSEGNLAVVTAGLVGERIVQKILDAIYPAVITSISDNNQVSLNFGSEFYNDGDEFEVYRRGDRIYDPYTKEFISWDEQFLGKLVLTRTLPKLSFGRMEAPEENLARIREELSDRSRQFVVYKVPTREKGLSAKSGEEKIDKLKQSIEESF